MRSVSQITLCLGWVTRPTFAFTEVSRWGFKALTLFRTSPSPLILLPCLGQRTKCTPPCFEAYSHVAVEQIHVIVITYLKYKQPSSSKSPQSCRQCPIYNNRTTDSHEIIYTLLRTERKKTIPCPAEHPRIVHIRKYTPRNFVADWKPLRHFFKQWKRNIETIKKRGMLLW